MRLKVSIVRVHYQDVEGAVREAVDLIGGASNYVEEGGRYLLKPNMISAKSAGEGVTSDLRIISALAKMVKEAGAHPMVGDCPGTAAYTHPETVFEATGLKALCELEGIELRVLDHDRPVIVTNPWGVVATEFFVPALVVECEGVINVPKFKTHSLTTLTAGVKNLFGLLPGGQKAESHIKTKNDPERFSNLLVDLYVAVEPYLKLNVLDAIVAMEGEGPISGDTVVLDLVLASHNPLALDMVASVLAGWDPMTVGTNFVAHQRGIGPRSFDEIEICGEPVQNLVRPLKKPQIFESEERFVSIRATIDCDEERCTSCGVCADICPGKAITLEDRPRFDYTKCIQCFCCAELCPQGALTIKRSLD